MLKDYQNNWASNHILQAHLKVTAAAATKSTSWGVVQAVASAMNAAGKISSRYLNNIVSIHLFHISNKMLLSAFLVGILLPPSPAKCLSHCWDSSAQLANTWVMWQRIQFYVGIKQHHTYGDNNSAVCINQTTMHLVSSPASIHPHPDGGVHNN
ncbi:hypothetical protein B0H10DRAFT_1962645 [Mycena sp. CBHHK59/15]|nr:hypothetical protein B0H10DRAFT_1962645 [Mycena sp. CBHHK59/15]